MRTLAAAVALAGLAALSAGCSDDKPKAAEPSASAPLTPGSASPSAVAPSGVPSGAKRPGNEPVKRKRVPEPTAAQARVYLATIARVQSGLVADRSLALIRAKRVCDRIVNPPKVSNVTLERYTSYLLSTGHGIITEPQAGQVIKAVRVWCR